jgi:hypothetical protein
MLYDTHTVRRLLVTANVVPNSPIIITLIMVVLRSSKTPALKKPHEVTSRKTAFFIVIAMKTSLLT